VSRPRSGPVSGAGLDRIHRPHRRSVGHRCRHRDGVLHPYRSLACRGFASIGSVEPPPPLPASPPCPQRHSRRFLHHLPRRPASRTALAPVAPPLAPPAPASLLVVPPVVGDSTAATSGRCLPARQPSARNTTAAWRPRGRRPNGLRQLRPPGRCTDVLSQFNNPGGLPVSTQAATNSRQAKPENQPV